MVLDAIAPPLAKLGKRGDSYLTGMYSCTDPLVMDDQMVLQIETVVLVTVRGNAWSPDCGNGMNRSLNKMRHKKEGTRRCPDGGECVAAGGQDCLRSVKLLASHTQR